ncbi:hypothetical protein [Photorhabdus luminescens]|uniref:hypothetical protein n=1 Tax=Photorhabdus luminescens TaxID=29488 RepID=UPI0022407F9A|nr:hypothetical protein [Photorhabdus luminescens]MCW7764586.1 hypothetical protein [Photorhabdus luminescens subsp. venezuelensis]
MKEQSVSKKEVRFDTRGVFARMGEAVDILKKAAPDAFECKVACCEQQGKLRGSKKAVA